MTQPTQSSGSRSFLTEYVRTGRGTAAGDMLRHYWHPVCLSSDLKDIPYAVRMLGEDLVAYRNGRGGIGLIAVACAHRGASLEYGQITEKGLRCSYHGWEYDDCGNCLEMPLEPAASKLRREVRQTAYPVQEWAGAVWCYMGPERDSPPPLPKIDVLARTDGEVVLERGDCRNYSYLNFLENVADLGHAYVLHALVPAAVPQDIASYCDMSVDTDWHRTSHHCIETDYGQKSVVVHNTANAAIKFVNTWSVVLPTHFRFGGMSAGLPPDFTDDRRESGGMLRIIDDNRFEIFRYTLIREGNFRGTFFPRPNGAIRGLSTDMRGAGPKKEHDTRRYPAWEGSPPVEDLVMQESQREGCRLNDFLATSDVGVALMRRIWRTSMDRVAKGETPKRVATDDEGVVEPDTFKGHIATAKLVIGPQNLPTSRDGNGLIRNATGELVFGRGPGVAE